MFPFNKSEVSVNLKIQSIVYQVFEFNVNEFLKQDLAYNGQEFEMLSEASLVGFLPFG